MSRQQILSNLSCPKQIKTNYHLNIGKLNLMRILDRAYGTVLFLGVRKNYSKRCTTITPAFHKKSEQKHPKGVFTVWFSDYLFLLVIFFFTYKRMTFLENYYSFSTMIRLRIPSKWVPFQGLTPETRNLFVSPHFQFEKSSEPPQFCGGQGWPLSVISGVLGPI